MMSRRSLSKIVIIDSIGIPDCIDNFESAYHPIIDSIVQKGRWANRYKENIEGSWRPDLILQRHSIKSFFLHVCSNVFARNADILLILCDYNRRQNKFAFMFLSLFMRATIRITVFTNNDYDVITTRYLAGTAIRVLLTHMRMSVIKTLFLFSLFLMKVCPHQKTITNGKKKPKKDILVITNHFPPERGGIHTWLYELCNHFQHDNVLCFTNKTEGDDAFDQNQSFDTVRVSSSTQIRFGGLLKRLLYIHKCLMINRGHVSNYQLAEICRSILHTNSSQFEHLVLYLYEILMFDRLLLSDIVIVGSVFPVGITAYFLFQLFGIPYIVLAHGEEIRIWRNQRHFRSLMHTIYESSKIVVANSQYTYNLLLDLGLGHDKMTVIHPGANTDTFFPSSEVTKEVIPYDLEGKKIILTISHLVARKGQDIVLRALPDVLKEVPNAVYIIGGDGPHRKKLERMTDSLDLRNHVIFIGSISDESIADIMNQCDVFIMVSRIIENSVEGFGIIYAEAGACGKPVIGGRCGGVEDAIVDGVTGYLVDPTDIHEVAEKLITLLTDDKIAHTLGKNGLKRVQEELNWNYVANQFRKIAFSDSLAVE